MNTLEYLKQYKDIDNLISAKREQIAILRDKAEQTTTNYEIARVQTSIVDKTPNIIAKIIQEENEVKTEIEELDRIKHEIRARINLIQDNNCKAFLISRFINGNTVEKAAQTVNYSNSGVYNLQERAIKAFENANI